MNIIGKLGLILVGVGAIALLLGLVKLPAKDEWLRIGGFRASTTSTRTYPELRYGGVGLMVVGGLMVAGGSRRSGGR
jgi:hypothetical protein